MTSAQASIWKRVGRSIVVVLIGAGVEFATGTPYGLLVIPILQGIGKWIRESTDKTMIPF